MKRQHFTNKDASDCDVQALNLPNEIIVAILRHFIFDDIQTLAYATDDDVKKAIQQRLTTASHVSRQWHACAKYIYHGLCPIFHTIFRQKRLTDFIENHLNTYQNHTEQAFVVDRSRVFYHVYAIWPRHIIWSIHRYNYNDNDSWSLYSHNRNSYHTLRELGDILVPE